MLRAIATNVRDNSAVYVRSSGRLPTTDEIRARQAGINAQANKLDALADADRPKLEPKAEADAMSWIEAVSEFDADGARD